MSSTMQSQPGFGRQLPAQTPWSVTWGWPLSEVVATLDVTAIGKSASGVASSKETRTAIAFFTFPPPVLAGYFPEDPFLGTLRCVWSNDKAGGAAAVKPPTA